MVREEARMVAIVASDEGVSVGWQLAGLAGGGE